jgi:hypothetical protein
MKTRWESCVFFLLMLLPGAWLIISTLWPGDFSGKVATGLKQADQVHVTQAQVKKAMQKATESDKRQ